MRNLFLLMIACACMSCEDCVFSSPHSEEPVVRFYRKNSRRALAPAFDSVQTGRGITIYRAGDILYSSITSENPLPNSLALPIDPSRDTAAFVFFGRRPGAPVSMPARRDTLVLAYRRVLGIVSPDCGADRRIENLRILKHTYDSAQVVGIPVVLRTDSVHIRLFW
ncbi:hypothetical protein [Rhodoflexus sp.]